jgi:hypothetical protein
MKIEISDALFKKLQDHAIPLIDTPQSVLERWAEAYEASREKNPKERAKSIAPDLKLNPLAPPDLKHSFSQGEFNGKHFDNWNDLLRLSHIEAFAIVKSFSELRTITRASIQKGRFSERGYHYIEAIDLSIQGVDANRAWANSLRLAQYLKVPIKAFVGWRNKDGAVHPGESGVLYWGP